MESEWFNPCCPGHPHEGLTCREFAGREANRLELEMIRSGHDVETHGGKRVRYKGAETPLTDEIEVGHLGTIFSTVTRDEDGHEHVWVEWDFTEAELKARLLRIGREAKEAKERGEEYIPLLTTMPHHWEELEVLKSTETSEN